MRGTKSPARAAAILAALVIVFAADTARAAGEDARYRSIGPFYNPHTKSYFEVRRDNRGMYWSYAKNLAASRSYKGVPGRLAVIGDQQTMAWVEKNFPGRDELWIGLTYWCRSHRLLWTSGEEHPHGSYKNWDPKRWYRNDGINCQNRPEMSYMPVSLRSENGRYYWQATGSSKGFIGYIVEYPTGKE